jgi:hypothetical protein
MTAIQSAFLRDANRVPIAIDGLVETKSVTYAALTTGATGATKLFDVTGTVLVTLFAVCSADLTSDGAATVEAGITGNTASLIPLTTATTIDSGEIWNSATPASVVSFGTNTKRILSGTDIYQTIATEAVSGGTLAYYCVWTPVSSDGLVTAA